MTLHREPALRRWVGVREHLGLGALLVFAFFAWLGTGVAHAALAVMMVLLAADGRRAWKTLSRDPLTRIFVVFVAYLLLAAVRAAQQWPETARAQWAAVWPWLSLWLSIPVAWWLKGDWRRVWTILALAPLGLAAGIVKRSHWSEFPRWLDGERYEFGYTALGVSLLALIVIVGVLSFFSRASSLAGTVLLKAGLLLVTIPSLMFFLFVLLVAQSRGVWLGLVFALALLGGLNACRRTAHGAGAPGGLWPVLGIAGSIALAVAALLATAVAERLRSELAVIPLLFSGSEEQLPYTPWGARIHLFLWGLRLVAERPWWGFGPGANAPRHLLKLEFGAQDSGFLTVIEHFVHLHNAYLEVLLRFGLIGAALFACGLIVFLRHLAAGRREGILPADFHRFGLVVLLTVLFFGCYEFRLLHTDFRFLMMLFVGVFHTFALYPTMHGDQPSTGGGATR